ncbi:MAG TPA: hypothetical protein VFM35_00100 [Candidatus Binatia bacterium]|nr:hypothetical protein [Candidatus Binatia bacterium]
MSGFYCGPFDFGLQNEPSLKTICRQRFAVASWKLRQATVCMALANFSREMDKVKHLKTGKLF